MEYWRGGGGERKRGREEGGERKEGGRSEREENLKVREGWGGDHITVY